MPSFRFVRSLRWPPTGAAWAGLAAGHAAVAGGAAPHAWEGSLRVGAISAGVLSLLLTAPSRGRLARAAGAILALASLASAGGALGVEAERGAAPLEVHPKPIEAELFGFVADASRADQRPSTLRRDVDRVVVGSRETRSAATVRLLWPTGARARRKRNHHCSAGE